MTALRIHYRSEITSTEQCVEEPSQDAAQDDCHIILPLREPGQSQASVRMLQFDRSGDQFILSPYNSSSLREWYEGHPNTAEIQNTLRVLGSLLRIDRVVDSGMQAVFTVFAQYLVTGDTRVPGAEDQLGDPFQLANAILSTFTDSGDDVLSRVLGRLQVIRRSSWVDRIPGMRDRISWVNSILDVVPQLQAFRRDLLTEADVSLLLSNSSQLSVLGTPARQRYDQLQVIDNFCREMVLTRTLQRPYAITQSTVDAMNAYTQIYRGAIEEGAREDFSGILSDYFHSLEGSGRDFSTFLEDLEVLNTMAGTSEENMTRYFVRSQVSEDIGRTALQEAIRDESADADMGMDWFYPENGTARPSFARVVDLFWRNLHIHMPESERDTFRLGFQLAPFQQALDLAIDTNTTTRREYVLLGIAYLRRFFGSDGEVPRFRIYQGGEMRQVSIQVSREELADIRRYTRHLERQLEGSQEFSEVHLPILEAVACGVGAAGAVFAELYPQVSSDPALRLGIGTPFAAVGSAGCASLFSHFVIQPLTGYRNRPFAEGMVSLGGAILGGAAYFLLSFFLNGGMGPQDDPGMRFPVDPYGP